MTLWNQDIALEFAKEIEKIAPLYGFHTGLTGGCLYKGGFRKDCDLIFYPHNGDEGQNKDGLMAALLKMGVKQVKDHGCVLKCNWAGRELDCFFLVRDQDCNYPGSD